MKRIRRRCVIGVTLMLLCSTMGCQLKARTRTLPDRIDAIYIPMARSSAYEYGLEEKLTNALIEEFLADGRLDVVRERRADATLLVDITKYVTKPTNFDSDEFPYSSTIDVYADITLVEKKKRKSLLKMKALKGSSRYVSDKRRISYESLEDAKLNAVRGLVQAIVASVLTSDDLKPEEPTESVTEPQADDLEEPAS